MIVLVLPFAASLGFMGGVALAQATRFPGEDSPGREWFLGCLGAILLAQGVDLTWVEVWLLVVEAP